MDERMAKRRVYGADHDDPDPGPQPGREYRELCGAADAGGGRSRAESAAVSQSLPLLTSIRDSVLRMGVGDRTTGRTPSNPWEYATTAADQLLLWHGQSAPTLLEEPLRTRAVVLLAACISDRADGPTGPDVLAVPLAALVKCLDRYSASALEAADAPAGTGDEERQELLAAYGAGMFDGVRLAVRQTLEHHLADSGPEARIEDRRAAFTDVEHRRQMRLLAELFPVED